MREIRGDAWDYHQRGDWLCITTNGCVRRDGAAVMGRGIAAQAKMRFPQLEYEFGGLIKLSGNHVHCFRRHRLISFPVKHHWRDRADISLIQTSCYELSKRIQYRKIRRVILPRPGCGNGQLDWQDVRDAIYEILPDSVWVITNA